MSSGRTQSVQARERLDEGSIMQAINLAQKLAMFSEHWQPRTVGQFNGHDLMVVKVEGEFTWHKHDETSCNEAARDRDNTGGR